MRNDALTQDRLKYLIHYDPETGVMTRRVSTSNCVKVGDIIKGKSVRGYRRAMVDGIRYKAHDLAWLYMTGRFPEHIVDHIDCNPDNMRWTNLREATQQQNCFNRSASRNNTSGFKGVKWHKSSQRWEGWVGFNHGRVFAGSFSSKDHAARAVMSLRERLYGEFVNHGVSHAA